MTQTFKTIGAIAQHVVLFLIGAIIGLLSIGPLSGKYQFAPVLSGSMDPFMPPGSLIVATAEDLQSVTAGHVLTFRDPIQGSVVTHRVIEVIDRSPRTMIRTKGDANQAPDPWTAALREGPVWRTRAVIPHLGRVVLLVKHPATNLVATRILPVLIGIWWLASIWRTPPTNKTIPAKAVARTRR